MCVSIAKLIAMCFIDNPNKHKNDKFIDGDENNYNVSNLEWVKNTIKQPKSDEDKKSRKKEYNTKYMEEFKEDISKRKHKWYVNNKERISELAKDYYRSNEEHFKRFYICEICGVKNQIRNKLRHEQSKFHNDSLEKLNNIPKPVFKLA